MNNHVKVYVWCERGDEQEIRSPVFEISQQDWLSYQQGQWDDSQVWPAEWLEFEDEIRDFGSSCLELVQEAAE